MSEQQDKILSNKLVVWLTILIIPMVGLVLSVYEIFFQKDGPRRGAVNPRVNTEKMYADAKVEETKGEVLSAFAKYSSIYDLYPQSSAGKKSRENIESIKASTKEKITKLAAAKNWRELKKMENIVAQILPGELEWLQNQVKYKGKTPNENTTPEPSKTWVEIEKKLQPLLSKKKYEKAIRLLERHTKQIVEQDEAIFLEKKTEVYYLGGEHELKKAKTIKAKKRALSILQKAIKTNPQSPFAQKARDLIAQQGK